MVEEGVSKEWRYTVLGGGKGGIVYIEDRICRRLGAELRAGCCKLEVEMGI